ncbi:hypothetical protein HBH72_229680 [Parastagonospora nodorum]|nr:hypothetical protein HBH72_229680 [Parastagonospora nodorum]
MESGQMTSPPAGAGDVSPTGNFPGTSASSKMRKRTKTGCLTCRKRRIKCGEERPTCANCIKSKRQCEGYNQRVIFKTPIENWPNHPGNVSTIQYHTSMLPGTRNQSYHPHQSQDDSLLSIQPRPLNSFDFSAIESSAEVQLATSRQAIGVDPHNYAPGTSYQHPLPSPHHQQPLISPRHHPQMSPAASYFPHHATGHPSPVQYNHEPTVSYQSSPRYSQDHTAYPQLPISYNQNAETTSAVSQDISHSSLYRRQSATQADDQNSYHSYSSVSPRSDHYNTYAEARPVLQRYNSHPQSSMEHIQGTSAAMSQYGSYNYPTAVLRDDINHSSYSSTQIPIHDLTPDVKYMQQPVLEQNPSVPQTEPSQPQLSLSGFGGIDHVSPTQVLDEAAIENEDDDYWDLQSDEEMLDAEDRDNEDNMLASKEFNIIRRIHHEHANELAVRRHDAFIYEGLLTNYKPEYAASPLRNLQVARVFAHYIHVTGPSVSIYERNPRNSTMIFEDSIPAEQQSLWTYTLPLKALGNQGLLHAMLALASLQIARLQGASLTPSYKHYAYSLKRLSRSLGHPKKRLSLSTLANSMLLAYYEVWTAEHVKWSTHLVGAAQLLIELDFRSLTREARRLKAAQNAEDRQFPYQNSEILIDQKHFNKTLEERAMMPDQNLVSAIIGKKVNYDDFGMIVEETGARYETKTNLPDKLDLQTFETLQDLYWWYARHDAFQSIVSGNPLILPYRKWSDCPPRAPLGRADALYGTHDHMILLIGRITDFTVQDRARKIRQVDADGSWRPRPGMPGFGSMGPPPSTANASSGGQPPTSNKSMGPPSNMKGPPSGWTGPPPPGWKRPSPPGFGRGQGAPSAPTDNSSQGREPSRGPPPPAMPEFLGMAPSGPHAPLSSTYANPNYQRSPPTPSAPHPKYADLPAAYQAAMEEWETITAAHNTVSSILTNTESFAPLPPDTYPPVPGGTGNMTPFGPALIHRSYDISIIWCLLHLAKIMLLRSHPAMPPAAQMAAGVGAPATKTYAMLIGRITAGMQLPAGEDLSPSLGAVLTESSLSLFFAGVQYQAPAQREWLITRLVDVDRRTGWASAGIIAQGCETAWDRAAAMGRGPPYKRRLKRVGEEGPLLKEDKVAEVPRDRLYEDEEDASLQRGGPIGGGQGNRERGFVVKNRPGTWAMNLLGTEEDLRAGMERVGL